MNRYWDLEEKSRAELTEDQVRAFLDVELMEKGLVKVKPPVLQNVEAITLTKIKVVRVKAATKHGHVVPLDIGFPTIEAAQAFLELAPVQFVDDWETKTTWAAPMREASIFTEEVVEQHVAMAASITLKSNRAKDDANQKAEREFHEAARKIDEATKGVWDDWHELQAKSYEMQRVLDTKAEYERLAGDPDTALKFLLKAYAKPTIEEACAWKGEASPFVQEARS